MVCLMPAESTGMVAEARAFNSSGEERALLGQSLTKEAKPLNMWLGVEPMWSPRHAMFSHCLRAEKGTAALEEGSTIVEQR